MHVEPIVQSNMFDQTPYLIARDLAEVEDSKSHPGRTITFTGGSPQLTSSDSPAIAAEKRQLRQV